MSTTTSAYIETVGTLVRGRYGNLARITGVCEWTRCSPNHLTAPNDVVVEIEPVGPGFNHRCSWASDLTLAQPGDVGAHNDEGNRYVRASWAN